MTQISSSQSPRRIVIVGGGFGGICTALALARQRIPNVHIRVINRSPYMQYYATLYRVATGGSPMEVCIPLSTIFRGKEVEVVTDTVTAVDTKAQTVTGAEGSVYHYDELIPAPGSQAAYFNIPGMEQQSFGIQSINDALRLKRHLHEMVEKARLAAKTEDKVPAATITVVGGGATGVELSGNLGGYVRAIARQHGLDPSFVTINLIEAMPRLLTMLPEAVSARILAQLQKLGINVFLNRVVEKAEPGQLILKDMQMKTDTVVWTAGVKASSLLGTIAGLTLDKRGRVTVDAHLEAVGCPHVYAVGDSASTKFAGMAQTAVEDGKFLGAVLAAKIRNTPLPTYEDHAPAFAIPAGPGWAAVKMGSLTVYGRLGWWMRRAADLIAFKCVLPLGEAVKVFLWGNEESAD